MFHWPGIRHTCIRVAIRSLFRSPFHGTACIRTAAGNCIHITAANTSLIKTAVYGSAASRKLHQGLLNNTGTRGSWIVPRIRKPPTRIQNSWRLASLNLNDETQDDLIDRLGTDRNPTHSRPWSLPRCLWSHTQFSRHRPNLCYNLVMCARLNPDFWRVCLMTRGQK